jgi:hypothetical protein
MASGHVNRAQQAEHIYGQPRLRKRQFGYSRSVACSHLSGLNRP